MKQAAEDSTRLFHGRTVVVCALLAVMLAFGSAPALAQESEEETAQSTEAAEEESTDSLGGQSLESRDEFPFVGRSHHRGAAERRHSGLSSSSFSFFAWP